MRTGRPKPPLVLTAEERETLERWARRPKTAQALAHRARMVLSCAVGRTNAAIAAELRVTRQTVGRWTASCASVWTGCSMNHGQAPRARSPMRPWSAWCG